MDRRRRAVWLALIAILALPLPARAATAGCDGVRVGLPAGSVAAADAATALSLVLSTAALSGAPACVLVGLLAAGDAVADRPIAPGGPPGLAAQLEWAAAWLRTDTVPNVLEFRDGRIVLPAKLTLQERAVWQVLAAGRSQAAWLRARAKFARHPAADEVQRVAPAAPRDTGGVVLGRPWPAGTNVAHLSFFDHYFPDVDRVPAQQRNRVMIDYLGRTGSRYDGHDGHDYTFPDAQLATPVLAAAPGTAYAFGTDARGLGVVIRHAAGFETVYWHLGSIDGGLAALIDRQIGLPVAAGERIGTSGASGTTGVPHLHFEVRRHGRQFDPYGWYGPAGDPCAGYAWCATSSWLWSPALAGEFDFTPPVTDAVAPRLTMTVDPDPAVGLLARLDGDALQAIGQGTPQLAGAPTFVSGRVGDAVTLSGTDRLAYAAAPHLDPALGAIALWVYVPLGAVGTVLASSADPTAPRGGAGTLELRRELRGVTYTWVFATVGDAGTTQRDELLAADGLAPGWRHLVVVWRRSDGLKQLSLDGRLAASTTQAPLPAGLGLTVELGRLAPDAPAAPFSYDELVIYRTIRTASQVSALANGSARFSITPVPRDRITVDVNAMDRESSLGELVLYVDDRPVSRGAFRETLLLQPPAALWSLTVRIADVAGNATAATQVVPLGRQLFVPRVAAP